MSRKDRWLEILRPFIVGGPNSKGEYRAKCPIHGADGPGTENRPSASFNFDKGVWHCSTCDTGGSLATLANRVKRGLGADSGPDYDPFANISDLDTHRAKKRGEDVEPLTEAMVKGYHDALMADEELLDEFGDRRGIDPELVDRYQIGWERRSKRFTIPIRDADGRLVNLRRYRPDAEASQKMVNWPGHGSPPRLYPLDQLGYNDILLVEGELDALIAIQNGLHAISGTGGANRWDNQWTKLFAGKNVSICYDNDKDGRTGAKKAARSLLSSAASVVVLPAVVAKPKGDITDFFQEGGTKAQLLERIAKVEQRIEAEAGSGVLTPAGIQVIGSMDSTTNGKPLQMSVTIVGKKNPTYSVPKKALMECTMDVGAKCKACPMYLEHEGEYEAEIDVQNVDAISRFIDATEEKTLGILRQHIGAQKCNRLTAEVLEAHTVEELFVMSSVDRRSTDKSDYTQRRVYNIGTYTTETNTVANIVGTTWPSPKDRRNEFFSWHIQDAVTSIDAFEVSPAMVERLKVFRPVNGQTPLEKCREIAEDLSANVTHIYGRERLHIAYDLVYHSVLNFPLDNKTISRGWLEFLVVGDTRTGKSESVQHLSDHYRLGHIIGCEGATFAGLVGAVKQIGKDWTITWGELTVNDRRLCILDETSGLSQELISQMSDIRSRGIAQLTKVESQETRARVRSIWISNPRKGKGVDEKKVDGVDIIEDLIGNPEDIARFDFAMSVRTEDVAGSFINNPDARSAVPHIYTSDLCHELILWAWSRKASQVTWKPDAYRAVYEWAERLGKKYVDRPPLIQRTNVREKIARIAVALAARTFSTDDSGEVLVVEKAHVEGAANFLDDIYSYDNFGYLRISRRKQRNEEIAKKNRIRIRRWLKEHPRLLEFLLDRRGSFRAQDLEEMAFMQRDEVNLVLSKLSDAKMISKDRAQIIMEPELQRLLKGFE